MELLNKLLLYRTMYLKVTRRRNVRMIQPKVQVGRRPIVNKMSLMQVMVLSPARVWPGLQLTSTTVPTTTGKVLVVVISDKAAGSSVHVSEESRLVCEIINTI